MHPVLSRILDIRSRTLEPLADQLRVELTPRASITAPPMVLLMGNHSSGKSSLINHLLQRNVQRTGVAPTDDGFTVLLHGEDERNLDGQTLTSNPDLPFAELNRFGPGLVQHCYGRVIKADLLKHVRLIDSPGMIDASGSNADRPYDFMAVVRWFSERSDLILLFFDPEKPGTTSETLSALTEALHGVDHKLHIVMNKMDLFEGIRDFARTYGALCWNLSRNLPTKDIPHIYTTVIPELARPDSHLPLEGFASALLELESYINELPLRRIDTVLSTAMDETRCLWMRSRVLRRIRRQISLAGLRVLGLTVISTLIALTAAWYQLNNDEIMLSVAWSAVAVLLVIGGVWLAGFSRRQSERYQIRNLESVFRDEFENELIERHIHNDILADWQQVEPGLHRSLQNAGLKRLGTVGSGKIKQLRKLIDVDLPELR